MAQKYNPLLQYGFQETTSGGGGGGGGLATTFKGFAVKPLFINYGFSIASWYIEKSKIFFNPYNPIQIHQDTEINKVNIYVTVASATDNILAGLYKYDYDNDEMQLQCEWNISPIATGSVTTSLAAPITISSGLYFVGFTSFDQTCEVDNINMNTSSARPIIPYWDASQRPGIGVPYNDIRYNLPSFPIVNLPSTILGSDLTHLYFTYSRVAPKLIF